MYIKIDVYWDVTLFRLVVGWGLSEQHSACTMILILCQRKKSQTLFHNETLLLMLVPHHYHGRSPVEIVGSNPTGGMDVCLLWVLCVLSGRGLCDELITRPEESYRLWCVVMCDIETSGMRRHWPTAGLSCQKQTNKIKLKINNIGWVIIVLTVLYKQALPEYACLLKISISLRERERESSADYTHQYRTEVMSKILQFFHVFTSNKILNVVRSCKTVTMVTTFQ
jgi:hypothetical protein